MQIVENGRHCSKIKLSRLYETFRAYNHWKAGGYSIVGTILPPFPHSCLIQQITASEIPQSWISCDTGNDYRCYRASLKKNSTFCSVLSEWSRWCVCVSLSLETTDASSRYKWQVICEMQIEFVPSLPSVSIPPFSFSLSPLATYFFLSNKILFPKKKCVI